MDEDRREEERPVARAPAPVPVTVVEVAGPTVLVQWEEDGVPQRGYIPAKEVKQGASPAKALKAAAPYGVQWSKYAQAISLSPADIESALRRKGIWTLDDLALNRSAACSVVFDMFGLNDLLRRVNKARK